MKSLLPIIPILALVSCQTDAEKSDPGDPAPATETPAVTLDTAKPSSLVGHPLEKVQAACDAAEIKHRVIEIDGKPLPATMDMRPDRLNFVVKKGVVTAVTKG